MGSTTQSVLSEYQFINRATGIGSHTLKVNSKVKLVFSTFEGTNSLIMFALDGYNNRDRRLNVVSVAQARNTASINFFQNRFR